MGILYIHSCALYARDTARLHERAPPNTAAGTAVQCTGHGSGYSWILNCDKRSPNVLFLYQSAVPLTLLSKVSVAMICLTISNLPASPHPLSPEAAVPGTAYIAGVAPFVVVGRLTFAPAATNSFASSMLPSAQTK